MSNDTLEQQLRTENMETALAPGQSWRTAYPYVEHRARMVLDTLEKGATLSTTALVERLYAGSQTNVTSRLFKALKAASIHGLERYCTKGEPEAIGRNLSVLGRRNQWHRPEAEVIPPAKSCCPTCKRPL